MKKLFLLLAIGFAPIAVLADWHAPLSQPPLCSPENPGCAAPIHAGDAAQVKAGRISAGVKVGQGADTQPFGFLTQQPVFGTRFCFFDFVHFDGRAGMGANCIGSNWKTGGDPSTGTFVNSIRSGTPSTITITPANGTGDVVISGTGGGTGGVTGSGLTNRLAKWTGSTDPSTTLTSSLISDNGTTVTINGTGGLTTSKICLPDATHCISSWSDIFTFAGVARIIAGTNVTISPASGTSAVTINSTGGGGSGSGYWSLNSVTGDISSTNPGAVIVDNKIKSTGTNKGFCLGTQCIAAWGDALNFYTDANWQTVNNHIATKVGTCPAGKVMQGLNTDGTAKCVPDSGAPGATGADGLPAPLVIPVFNNPGAPSGAINGSIWLCMSNCQ